MEIELRYFFLGQRRVDKGVIKGARTELIC